MERFTIGMDMINESMSTLEWEELYILSDLVSGEIGIDSDFGLMKVIDNTASWIGLDNVRTICKSTFDDDTILSDGEIGIYNNEKIKFGDGLTEWKLLNYRMITCNKYDTSANLTALNEILSEREIGIESDTEKIKIGRGNLWSDTDYLENPEVSQFTNSINITISGDDYIDSDDQAFDGSEDIEFDISTTADGIAHDGHSHNILDSYINDNVYNKMYYYGLNDHGAYLA